MSCLGRLLGRLLGPRPAAADCSAAHDMSLSSPQCPLRPSPANMSAMFDDVQDVDSNWEWTLVQKHSMMES